VPRPPHLSPALEGLPRAVYSTAAARLATYEGERYPFHVGDTFREPPAGCHMEDLKTPGDEVLVLAPLEDRGILLAPGTSFGPFPTRVRVCFTSVPPDVALRGVDALARVLRAAGRR